MPRHYASIALVTAALFAVAPLAGAAVKCWTNKEGVRECGNAVPPEYAQGETRTLDKQGVTIEVNQRAKTAAELEAEARDGKSAANRAADEKRRREEQRKTDEVLLATFASEQDIVMARDRHLSALQGTIDLTTASLNKQKLKVEEYRTRIANLERSGKPVPAELTGDMATEQQKFDNKQAFIAAKRAEIEAIHVEYDRYLKRYRELLQGL